MPAINKRLMRLASAIHDALAVERCREPLIELPIANWQSCVDLVRQVRRSQLRGWHLAAGVLLDDVGCSLSSLQRELAAIQQRLPCSITKRLASTGDIYGDAVALDQEFDELDYDCRVGRLSVTTEPIALEGIYLGSFEIRLEWARSGRAQAPGYRVIAKDPHPVEGRENVTHPHVMDEILCEGDGKHAIRQALSQGRLLDFFTLVAGILRTYNQESPFVELALWYGSSCSDCGAVVSEDESYSCQKCGETVCSECETVCCGCDDACCSSCIASCATCDDNFCVRCLKPCDGCQKRACSGCLKEHERCPNCHEEESSEELSSDCAPSPDHAALQPNGVGQASVPA